MALWTLPDTVRAAIVAFTVVTGAAGAVGVASVNAQESTPAVECVAPDLPPGTPSAVPEEGAPPPAAEGTPEAEHDMAAMEEASPEAVEVDEGTAADADGTAAVTAAVENFAGCITAGDAEGVAALVTTNYLVAQTGSENPYDLVANFQFAPVTIEAISDVRTHEDGRVSVDVLYGGFYTPGALLHERWYFVDDAGTLKLDEAAGELYPADVVAQAELRDYEFALSQTSFPAGQSIAFELTNAGTEPHEMVIAQLPEGATLEQAFNGEIPFEEINFVGVGFADPGQTGYMAVTGLEPGTYTLVCFIPSADGTPHFVKGMVGEFVVE
jgi:uncharacterized cupredoxin-like copper-binding protein